jgi:hypothetical protein
MVLEPYTRNRIAVAGGGQGVIATWSYMLSLSIASSDVVVCELVWCTRFKVQMLQLVGICLAWSIHVPRVLDWSQSCCYLFHCWFDYFLHHFIWVESQLDHFLMLPNILPSGLRFVLRQKCVYSFEVIWCASVTWAFWSACIYLCTLIS